MPREPRASSDAQLVAEACGRAALVLGLNKEGELALLLLRVYRSLHAHCGKGCPALPTSSWAYTAEDGRC